ncbi:MAG: lycopene cyclase family protein [Sediminibacterium sp.]
MNYPNRLQQSPFTHYHYIITGAGCAGLSLLMRMMEDAYFADKQILVIDQSPKVVNDRTWCFWEKGKGLFEPVVYHQWQQVNFFSDTYSAVLDLHPYQYKMIRGIDFYTHVLNEAAKHPNIGFRYEKIKGVENSGTMARVALEEETVTADYVFNSILFHPTGTLQQKKRHYYLLQHFKGWLIETKQPCFDPAVATLMDFRISQEYGTGFMYVMPVSATAALVEYTLFSEALLPAEVYEKVLEAYIRQDLGIHAYAITQEEFGVIPMTNHPFSGSEGRVIHTGIAGGQAKGSSGYVFQFIQKRTQAIVEALRRNHHPRKAFSFADKKFHFYDSVLLQVLHYRKMKGHRIFAGIFRQNPPERVLRFLDNETSLGDDLRIMRSVPTGVFLPAAMREIFF